jgi:hypothetical protein
MTVKVPWACSLVIAEDSVVPSMIHCFDDPYKGGIVPEFDYGIEDSMHSI